MPYANPLDERLRAARRKHYNNNKKQYKARNEAKKLALREYINNLKSKPCTDCRQSYPPYVMEFDHLPEFQKLIEISKLHTYGSRAKIDDEVAKCELVCANCHRIRTHNRYAGATVGKPGSLQNSCQIGFDS